MAAESSDFASVGFGWIRISNFGLIILEFLVFGFGYSGLDLTEFSLFGEGWQRQLFGLKSRFGIGELLDSK